MSSAAVTMERPREGSASSRKAREGNQRRDAVINVRLTTKLRDLIDRAADVVGKTRSDFILESARKHAIDVLLDQRLFSLDSKQYDEFLRVLDEPLEPNVRLKQLLASKSPWEK
jgi:uncharacterized protein (DUF1778 family)